MTALPVEYSAMRALLAMPTRVTLPGDPNNYDIGELASAEPGVAHRVALTMLAQDGTRTAAAACTEAVRSFPATRCVVACGIAGGIPGAGHDSLVHIGDVVVATAIVDYGHVRSVDGRQELRRQPPRGPSYDLLRAANELRAKAMRGDRPWDAWLDNDTGRPAIHHGVVASGDRLLRDAHERDQLAAAHGVLAVEMEASGIAVAAALRDVDWFMVRGVADHCDGAKSDRWHPNASLAAAAYLRALLAECRPFAWAMQSGPPSLENRKRLVDLLLGVPAVAELDSRQSVIRHLPPMIRDSVRRHAIARVEVLNLVSTCFDYPDGFSSLIAAIRLVDGDSPALHRFVVGLGRDAG